MFSTNKPAPDKRLSLASRLLALALCILSTVACLSTELSLTPMSTATHTPVPSPTRPPTPSPTRSPNEPTPSLPPAHAPALRPQFIADLDLFPNVPRYEIDLSISPDMLTITGHERVTYVNTEDVALDALYLRLFPNTPGYGGDMDVTNISLNGRQSVDPRVELGGSALRLPLEPPLEPGAQLDLTLEFSLVVPTEGDPGYRQLGYYDDVLTLANAYPLIPVYDDEGWNVELAAPYGDAVYSETAFYTVRVTALADLALVASGTCSPPTVDAQGNATWVCVTGPMRDFNAILGPDYEIRSQTVEGTTVNSYSYSYTRQTPADGGELVLDWASEAVRLFSTRFGPYPFTELDVVETPTRAGGIEYPGLVVINSGYYETLSDRMEWVVVHEVGHQWWYSLVGNDQVDEPWLDEALVQYSTLLYYENCYGTQTAATLVDQVFQQTYEDLVSSNRDALVGLPVAAYSGEDYGPVVYQKGPLYFHALRQEVGDEDFWAILQTYFTRNRYDIARPEDWLSAVEAVTGDEHRALYEEWILGATRE